MVKLQEKEYSQALKLLPKEGMNTLFAGAVLTGGVQGEVYADRQEKPANFYIRHPQGMTLLLGEPENEEFPREFINYALNRKKERNQNDMMQVYPPLWNALLERLLDNQLIDKGADEQYRNPLAPEEADKVIQYRRSDFRFQSERFYEFKQKNELPYDCVVETSESVYHNLAEGVVPCFFWNSYQEFKTNGMGFTYVTKEGIPVSTAFAAFVTEKELEIGIETKVQYRGKGYAALVCARLIEYCLEKGYEPVWGCNSGNVGSRSLAIKLGFEEVQRRPYYRLPV